MSTKGKGADRPHLTSGDRRKARAERKDADKETVTRVANALATGDGTALREALQEGDLRTRIQERLSALGLNALSAAKKAGLGDDFVRDILRGKVRKPSAERLARLAEALECSVNYLLGAPDPAPEFAHRDERGDRVRVPPPLARRGHWTDPHANIPNRGVLPIKYELSRAFRRTSEVQRDLGAEAASVPMAYADRDAWIEVVRDEHAAGIAKPGSLIVVSALSDLDRPGLQDGDHVVVERHLVGPQAVYYLVERTVRVIRQRYPSFGMWFFEFPANYDDEDISDDIFDREADPPNNIEIERKARAMAEISRSIPEDEAAHPSRSIEEHIEHFIQVQKMRPRIVGRVLRVITPVDAKADFGLTPG